MSSKQPPEENAGGSDLAVYIAFWLVMGGVILGCAFIAFDSIRMHLADPARFRIPNQLDTQSSVDTTTQPASRTGSAEPHPHMLNPDNDYWGTVQEEVGED